MTGKAVTLTGYGKPAPPSSHSPWKTLRVSHRLTASTTGISALTSYRGTHDRRHQREQRPRDHPRFQALLEKYEVN